MCELRVETLVLGPPCSAISLQHLGLPPERGESKNAFVGQLLQLPGLKKVASGYHNTRGTAMTAVEDA